MIKKYHFFRTALRFLDVVELSLTCNCLENAFHVSWCGVVRSSGFPAMPVSDGEEVRPPGERQLTTFEFLQENSTYLILVKVA